MTTKRAVLAGMALPLLASGVIAVLLYRVGTNADPFKEPTAPEAVIGGIIFAAPFVALFSLHFLCALAFGLSASRIGRTWCLVTASAGSLLVAGVVLWWFLNLDPMQNPVGVACLLGGLLFSLAPAWVAHLGEAPAKRPTADSLRPG